MKNNVNKKSRNAVIRSYVLIGDRVTDQTIRNFVN